MLLNLSDVKIENYQNQNLSDVIKSSIAGYLIKQSYSKLNDKYDIYISSQSNKKPEEIVYNENDLLEMDLHSNYIWFIILIKKNCMQWKLLLIVTLI